MKLEENFNFEKNKEEGKGTKNDGVLASESSKMRM